MVKNPAPTILDTPYIPLFLASLAFVVLLITLSPRFLFERSLDPNAPVFRPTAVPTLSRNGAFCGGIAATRCPEGKFCRFDGNHPDAGGICQPFECPVSGWVDCMPGPGPQNPQCAPEYIDWIQASCPDFEGIAY